MKALALILILIAPMMAAELPAPPMPDTSPVEEFRKLLKMSEAEREADLAAHSPENRKTLEEKLHTYQAFSESDRQRHLNAIELRWYLRNLIGYPVNLRAEKIAKVPIDLRKILQERLLVWDQLPATTRKQILENEMIDFLSQPPNPKESVVQKENVVEAFYKMPEVAKTISAIGKLPDSERSKTMAAFGRFARMGDGERRVFLQKVDRWKKMSSEEKEAWRNVAKELPDLPPLPPGFQLPQIDPPKPPGMP